MENMIIAGILTAVSLLAFVMGIRSYMEKGFLLNNAYIYASAQERKTKDWKPYYKQSAVVLFLLGAAFLMIGLAVYFQIAWLYYIADVVLVIALVYAVVSGAALRKNRK